MRLTNLVNFRFLAKLCAAEAEALELPAGSGQYHFTFRSQIEGSLHTQELKTVFKI